MHVLLRFGIIACWVAGTLTAEITQPPSSGRVKSINASAETAAQSSRGNGGLAASSPRQGAVSSSPAAEKPARRLDLRARWLWPAWARAGDGPLHACSDEGWAFTLQLNLTSVWLCMKHEIRQMLAQEPAGGAVVNTSSVNGLGGVAHGSLYAATKAGVLALTKSAAQVYAGVGLPSA